MREGPPGARAELQDFVRSVFQPRLCPDWMPQTDNVLTAYGGLVSDVEGIPLGVTAGHSWVRIVEVTHDTPAEKVFELFIDDQRPEGWSVYRAERLPSLYPLLR